MLVRNLYSVDPKMSQEDDSADRSKRAAYADPRHPKVAEVATRLLRTALAQAEQDAVSISDFWDVFSAYTQKYQYGQFLDSLVQEMKSELRAAIQREYHAELRLEAREELKREIRKQEEDAIFSEVYDELKARIESEIAEKLTLEVERDLRHALTARLTSELKPQVEAALKVELMGNPAFVEEARKEIQRKILGLQ